MIAALVGAVVGAVWRRTPQLLRHAPAQTAAIVAAVISAGFWLSFGAVAAIVWVVQGRPPQPVHAVSMGALRMAARVQVAVTLALVPATVLLFQQVSPVAPLANAIAIPIVSWVVTPLALLGASVAALPGPAVCAGGTILGMASSVFAVVPPSFRRCPSRSGRRGCAGTAVSTGGAGGRGSGVAARPARLAGARPGHCGMLPLFVWPAERPEAGAFWVTALDVG
jgi:competence protein ComEC